MTFRSFDVSNVFVSQIGNERTGHKVFTIFGWSPGLHRLVSSEILDCGCFAGNYETWDRRVVAVLETPSPMCTVDGHRPGHVIAARTLARRPAWPRESRLGPERR